MIVEAPRSLSPLAFSAAAARIARGSKPAFSQNVRSSAVVVASRRRLGIWLVCHDATTLLLERPELDLAGSVVDDRGLGEGQVAERRGIGQVDREDEDGARRREPRQPPRTTIATRDEQQIARTDAGDRAGGCEATLMTSSSAWGGSEGSRSPPRVAAWA